MEIEEFDQIREEAKTYLELKDAAYTIIKKEKTIENLLKAQEFYDIDPTINNDLLLLELNQNYEFFNDHLEKYVNTLTLFQRKNLIREINKKKIKVNVILNTKSNKDIYLEMIKIAKEGNLKKFHKIFINNCTCEIIHFKIPLIYGDEELYYSFLLNHLYYNIIYKRHESNEENILGKGTNYSNEEQDILIKPDLPVYNCIKTGISCIKLENKELKVKTNENIQTNASNNLENNYIEFQNNEINITEEQQVNFENKILYLKEIINIIISKDFKDCFSFENNINYLEDNLHLHIKPLFFHLLFFDLALLIVTNFNIKNDRNNCLRSLLNSFFEPNNNKIGSLIYFKNRIIFYEKISDNVKKQINLKKNTKLKNKNYIIQFINDKDKEEILFNPFDYELTKLFSFPIKNSTTFKKSINNPEFFSFQKILKINRLFHNETLFNEYKKNIDEMITSNIINSCFNQMRNYVKFQNPFKSSKKEQFLNIVSQIILYFPFPNNNILGYTYKKLGLIFISTYFPNRENAKKETKILKGLNDISIRKNTELHEIIFHYTSIIFHANSKDISTNTPQNSFINYIPKEEYKETFYYSYDGGDRVESVLYGNKLTNIHFFGALYLLSKENWEEFDIHKFSQKFREKNVLKEGTTYNINEEDNSFIKLIIEEIKNKYEDNDIKEFKLTKKNSSVNLRIGDFTGEECDDEEEYCNIIGRINLKDGIFSLLK